MNNKDADQTVQMHKLVYTFVVHMQQIRFSYGKALIKKTKKKTFCGFSMGTGPGEFMICVFIL